LIVDLTGIHAQGATPLDADEAQGLMPRHISTQGQLNEWEQNNIAQAQAWLANSRTQALWREPLTEGYVLQLHKRMFNQTWRWAGQFRSTGKNIGVDPAHIAVRLRDLLADTQYWLQHNTYPLDEAAARFHHRLVSIHPFANGNGRHASLMTDVLLIRQGAQAFTWGATTAKQLTAVGDVRSRYLEALRAADTREFALLPAFVRS
jgi:Fic-DOC domain mobile mystery protein B